MAFWFVGLSLKCLTLLPTVKSTQTARNQKKKMENSWSPITPQQNLLKEANDSLKHHCSQRTSFNKVIMLNCVLFRPQDTLLITTLEANEAPLTEKLFHKRPKSGEASMDKHDPMCKVKTWIIICAFKSLQGMRHARKIKQKYVWQHKEKHQRLCNRH